MDKFPSKLDKLRSPNGEERYNALCEMRKLYEKNMFGEIPISELVSTMTSCLNDEDLEIRRTTVYVVGLMKLKQMKNQLLACLKDSDEVIRDLAAFSLGHLDDRAVVPLLLDALKDVSPAVRTSAIYALGLIGDPQAIEPLLKCLANDNLELNIEILWAIGRLKKLPFIEEGVIFFIFDGPKFSQISMAIRERNIGNWRMKDPDQNSEQILTGAVPRGQEGIVSVMMATMSEQLRADIIVKILFHLLSENEEELYSTTVRILRQLKGDYYVEKIISHLKDKNPVVRKAAVESLVGRKNVTYLLIDTLKDKHPSVRATTARLLGEMGATEAIKMLTKSLKDKDPQVRINSATSLGSLGASKAEKDLIKALGDKNPAVKVTIIKVLGKVGTPKVIDALKMCVEDQNDEVRNTALEILMEINA